MKVKKYSGDLVDFDIQKLTGSLSKSGASETVVNEVIATIKPQIYDGIHTKDLYQLAFNQLKRKSCSFAARYSLKRALRDLGPSGYHFERWAAKLFENFGYKTLTGQHLKGKAVSHEIDILGMKDNKLIIGECKFRNTTEAKISVTTPMYYLSRINDLKNLDFQNFGKQLKVSEGWLITNVYLTKDAISFANHYGINLLAWDYPEGNSIKNRVDHAGLYPLTCLTSLKKTEKNDLLDAGCILVTDVLKKPELLEQLNLSPQRTKKTIEEAEALIFQPVINN